MEDMGVWLVSNQIKAQINWTDLEWWSETTEVCMGSLYDTADS